MREIKFKAWDFESRKMFTPATIPNYIPEDGSHYEYLQFTGLKDKNGEEIYEGDIIRFTEIDEDSCFGREDTETVEVKWIEEIAQFRAVFKSGKRTELHFVVQLPTVVSCEVIGSIYENPELLKQ